MKEVQIEVDGTTYAVIFSDTGQIVFDSLSCFVGGMRQSVEPRYLRDLFFHNHLREFWKEYESADASTIPEYDKCLELGPPIIQKHDKSSM